jgi:hypothetical protein
MIEVVDGAKGIQDKKFLRRCERIMRAMRRHGLLTCVQPSAVELPSSSS